VQAIVTRSDDRVGNGTKVVETVSIMASSSNFVRVHRLSPPWERVWERHSSGKSAEMTSPMGQNSGKILCMMPYVLPGRGTGIAGLQVRGLLGLLPKLFTEAIQKRSSSGRFQAEPFP